MDLSERTGSGVPILVDTSCHGGILTRQSAARLRETPPPCGVSTILETLAISLLCV